MKSARSEIASHTPSNCMSVRTKRPSGSRAHTECDFERLAISRVGRSHHFGIDYEIVTRPHRRAGHRDSPAFEIVEPQFISRGGVIRKRILKRADLLRRCAVRILSQREHANAMRVCHRQHQLPEFHAPLFCGQRRHYRESHWLCRHSAERMIAPHWRPLPRQGCTQNNIDMMAAIATTKENDGKVNRNECVAIDNSWRMNCSGFANGRESHGFRYWRANQARLVRLKPRGSPEEELVFGAPATISRFHSRPDWDFDGVRRHCQ